MIKQMKYYPYEKRFDTPGILAHGVHVGYEYYILSFHTHPCAYIVLNENNTYFGRDTQETAQICCHGGITYSEPFLNNGEHEQLISKEDNKWVLGWDYAHADDRWGSIIGGKEWTTQEIQEEVHDVIEQIDTHQ